MRAFRDAALIAILPGLVMLGACHHKRSAAKNVHAPQPQHQISVPIGTTEEGLASWYGIPYHGRPAADGEIYDMEQLVAAHRTMPFNTWLKVTNLINGRTVNVRIIDRGPFVNGRIVDLSKAAARQIEMLGPGTANVRLEVISAPIDVPANDFYGVQIGAFANYGNAERIRAKLQDRFGFAQLALKQGRVPLYRVLVGRAASQAEAQQIATQLASEFPNVFIIRLDAKNVPGVAPVTEPASDTRPTGTASSPGSVNVIRTPEQAPAHSDKSGPGPSQ